MAKKLELNNHIGVLGEEIAQKFLMKQGFSIKSRNYLKKWGEIDIVATKKGKLYFFEVKTVSRETVTHETRNPAEMITSHKIIKLERVVKSYLADSAWKGEWTLKGVLVRVIHETREAHVELIDI